MSEDTTTERLQHALDRLNAGDNKARNDLIDFVAKRVGRIAGSMLRGHAVHRWEETGDLQQAALIRLNHYLSGDTPTSANHFLCLARWHTRNALRDMARHYFGPEGMGANHSTDGKGRDEGKPRVEQKRAPGDFVNRMMVLELIQNLPPEERKTVDFLFFDGLSQKEVAAELGKGVRSVKRLWQKAKLQLRAWMIGEESGQLARADVGEKLLDWEEGVERGQPASAEELCQTCPELKDELQRNIDALKAMSWMDENPGEDVDADDREEALSPLLQPPPPLQQLAGTILQMLPMGGWEFPDLRVARFRKIAHVGAEPVSGYREVRRLGQGGMSEVWEAKAPDGSSVALKIVRRLELSGFWGFPNNIGDQESRIYHLFLDIRHDHLLPILEVLAAGEWWIFITELAEETLKDRLAAVRREGREGIAGEELLRYMTEAALGIDFLNLPNLRSSNTNRAPIQHGDIKPANLLLVKGRLKIGDLGLATIMDKPVKPHHGLLTTAYAAPELIEEEISARSDQYSLAVSYCELRGGRLPFPPSYWWVTSRESGNDPELTMLPAAERPVVTRALARNPEDRWPSCEAFVQELRASAG